MNDGERENRDIDLFEWAEDQIMDLWTDCGQKERSFLGRPSLEDLQVL
jgi:hypothetical protein